MAGSGWETLPFGQLTENFDSIRVPVKEADRRPGRYPYYGASGIVDYVDSYLLDGEFLLAWIPTEPFGPNTIGRDVSFWRESTAD